MDHQRSSLQFLQAGMSQPEPVMAEGEGGFPSDLPWLRVTGHHVVPM